MAKETAKKQVRRSIVQRLILMSPDGQDIISRQELIKRSGLNPRTVDSYTAELETRGIIQRENIVNGLGRPETYYRSACPKVVFLGVCMFRNEIWITLADVNLKTYFLERIEMNLMEQSVQAVIAQVMTKIKLSVNANEYRLLGIGMVQHQFNQNSRKWKTCFYKLANELTKNYSAPVSLLNSCDAMLRSYYRVSVFMHPEMQNKRELNLALINPSDRIYLGLRLNGVFQSFSMRTNSMQKKLLEGVFTHGMIKDRFNELSKPQLNNYDIFGYREALFLDDPTACQVSREEAEQLAACIVRLKDHYNLDGVYLTNVTRKTMLYIQTILEKTSDMEKFPVQILKEFSEIHYLNSACEVAWDTAYGFFAHGFMDY